MLLASRDHTHSVYTEPGRCFSTLSVFTPRNYIIFETKILVEFMGFMSLGKLTASTITIYISGMRHNLKLLGKDDFQHSFLLKLVIQGIKNNSQHPDVCLPISITMLHDMLNALPLIHPNYYEVCMFSVLLAVGFHGLF